MRLLRPRSWRQEALLTGEVSRPCSPSEPPARGSAPDSSLRKNCPSIRVIESFCSRRTGTDTVYTRLLMEAGRMLRIGCSEIQPFGRGKRRGAPHPAAKPARERCWRPRRCAANSSGTGQSHRARMQRVTSRHCRCGLFRVLGWSSASKGPPRSCMKSWTRRGQYSSHLGPCSSVAEPLVVSVMCWSTLAAISFEGWSMGNMKQCSGRTTLRRGQLSPSQRVDLKWECTQKYRSQPSKCHRLKGPLMARGGS